MFLNWRMYKHHSQHKNADVSFFGNELQNVVALVNQGKMLFGKNPYFLNRQVEPSAPPHVSRLGLNDRAPTIFTGSLALNQPLGEGVKPGCIVEIFGHPRIQK
jgi:hypothetical protein